MAKETGLFSGSRSLFPVFRIMGLFSVIGASVLCGAPSAAYGRHNTAPPLPSSQSQAQPASVPSKLPNGVSSLAETYQDWRMMCQADAKGQAHCVVSQDILTTNRQNLLSMRFQPQGMQIRGEAVVPFNLDLSKGVSVLTDGKPVGDIYSFSTCLPTGCIVPMDMDEGQLSALEKSQKITVSVTFLSGKILQIPLSPRGLLEAMKRSVALSK